MGVLLALIALDGLVVGRVVGVAEGCVAVEGDLGVQHVQASLAGDDERVDLHEVGVALDVGPVQQAQQLDGLFGDGGIQLGVDDPPAAGLGRQALGGVDVDAGDGLGRAGGHLLDVHAALRREHAQVPARRAVEGEAGVVLLGDVGGLLDPEAPHEVAADVQTQDRLRVTPDLTGVGGRLDAAGLAAAAHVHLRLQHDRIADPVGGRDRLVGIEGHLARRSGQPVGGEELLALVFQKVHVPPPRKTAAVQRASLEEQARGSSRT